MKKLLFLLIMLWAGCFLNAQTSYTYLTGFQKRLLEKGRGESSFFNPSSTAANLNCRTMKSNSAVLDCESCGCSGTGGNMGYGTVTGSNFAGVRLIIQHYRSKAGIWNNSPWVNEDFNTLQVWDKIPVNSRIVTHIMIPYHFYHREFTDGTTQDIQGIGDITVLGFYKLIHPKRSKSSTNPFKTAHILELGGGVKIPTGKYDEAYATGSVNPGFQTGTGSWDYILASNYNLNYRSWGINALIDYRIKTENSRHYQFGNQWNYGINFYRMVSLNKLHLMPITGISVEISEKDKQSGSFKSHTSGNAVFGKIAIESSYNKWSLGFTSLLPISQKLNDGKVEVKNRLAVYLNYNF